MVATRAPGRRWEPGTITAVGRWAVVAAGLDLVTKLLAAQLHEQGVLPRLIVGTTNPGVPMGLGRPAFAIMLLLSLAALLGFGGWAVRLTSCGRAPAWATGLLVGGAIANLVDRIASGAVHDWIRLRPVHFNLADVFVVAGVVGLMLALVIRSPHSGDAGARSPMHAPEWTTQAPKSSIGGHRGKATAAREFAADVIYDVSYLSLGPDLHVPPSGACARGRGASRDPRGCAGARPEGASRRVVAARLADTYASSRTTVAA